MSIKIIKSLGDNKYEVEIPPPDGVRGLKEFTFGMVHDYVYFEGYEWLQNPDNSTSNTKFLTRIQIPIRDFVNVCLPFINKHRYSQPNHLKDREHTEDDPYWKSEFNEKLNLKGPRYKKGDKYPAYAFDSVAIKYYDEDKKQFMVSVRLRDEAVPTVMTIGMFNLIKDKLSI